MRCKIVLERATSYWASNTTWLQPKGGKTAQKGAKRVRHVVLGVRHVALGLQRDVAPPQRRQNSPKGSKKSAPRRIGPPPCRVEPPTRRGSTSKAAKQPKREQNERVTSYWDPAMSRWASNTTWLRSQGSESPQKGAKRAWPCRIGPPPCRVGPPTRRGSPTSDSIILRQALINGGVVILVASVVAFVEWVEIFS